MSIDKIPQKAMSKTISLAKGRVGVIERTHLLRIDGVERLSTVKLQSGPVAGFLDALARCLSKQLGKRPEDLRSGDLVGHGRKLLPVDLELRHLSSAVRARAEARHPNDDDAQQRFVMTLRRRVTARMLARLKPEFVLAANRLILNEAEERDADVWL